MVLTAMITPCCKEVAVYLGATIGATRLYGCPKCSLVYWDKHQ